MRTRYSILIAAITVAAGTLGQLALAAGPAASPANEVRTAANGQVQFEGQLLDLMTVSRQFAPRPLAGTPAAADVVVSNGGKVIDTPGLKVDASGMSRPPVAPATPPSDSSASAGTYSHSGAAAGSSDASAGMTSSSNKLGNEAPIAGTGAGVASAGGRPASSTGTPGNTGNWSGNGPVGSTTSGDVGGGIMLTPGTAAPASLAGNVKDELNAGLPAALVSGGHAYVLVCDAKQLASLAGQTVRVSGRSAGTVIIPDRIEARQSDGSYREIAFNRPLDLSNGTAKE